MRLNQWKKILGSCCSLLLSVTPMSALAAPESIGELSNLIKPVPRKQESNLPYLIEGDRGQPMIKIRCISHDRKISTQQKREMIRDTILSSPHQNQIIIEFDNNCRDLHIFWEEYHNYNDILNDRNYRNYPNYRNHDNNDWLTRPGSGWDWYLHRQK